MPRPAPQRPSARRAAGALVLALAAVGATACRTAAEVDVANGDDPLAALTTHIPSTRYSDVYWHRLARGATPADAALWVRAVAACSDAAWAERPTCGHVRAAAAMKRMATPPAPSGRTFSLTGQ